MKTMLILTSLMFVLASETKAEISLKESRLILRQPFAGKDPTEGRRTYDGWTITGDIFFYNRIVKHLKIIEKGAPEIYSVGQKYVKTIVRNSNVNANGAGSLAWPGSDHIAIGDRDLAMHWWGDSQTTAAIMHEFKHCDESGHSCEGAANWTAVVYGKQVKMNPMLISFYRAYAMRFGYSQEKWDSQ